MAQDSFAAVLWFTGLSGAGKSTLADAVGQALTREGKEVERVDGDALRAVFPHTGFSFEERDRQVRVAGLIASRLAAHGVWVVASLVSPYRSSRDAVRQLCPRFLEVHVSTPLAACEARDTKGLYAKARAGQLQGLTGVDDPYEAPLAPDLSIDTSQEPLAPAVLRVLARARSLAASGPRPAR